MKAPRPGRKTQRQQIAPRHTSEQRLAPELHAKIIAEYNAEIRRRNKAPTIPMPRYELTHTSPNPHSRDLSFTMAFHTSTPSAALAFAHHIAGRLDITLDWRDKHTGRTLVLSALTDTDL